MDSPKITSPNSSADQNSANLYQSMNLGPSEWMAFVGAMLATHLGLLLASGAQQFTMKHEILGCIDNWNDWK